MQSCGNLGVSYFKGIGVPKDPSRAAALFKKACDGGFKQAYTSFVSTSTSQLCFVGDSLLQSLSLSDSCQFFYLPAGTSGDRHGAMKRSA